MTLPNELRENCITYHRHPGFTECVLERAAKRIEELEGEIDIWSPSALRESIKSFARVLPLVAKYGYVPDPSRHEFVDDGTGLCMHEWTDDIGEGLVRHVSCGLLQEQPEHDVKGAKNA